MLNSLKGVSQSLIESCIAQRSVKHINASDIKPFFDVLEYINTKRDLISINNHPLDEYLIDSRLECLVAPAEIRLTGDIMSRDIKFYSDQITEPNVTPSQFMDAQYALFNAFRLSGNLDKDLKSVRNIVTLTEEMMKSIIDPSGARIVGIPNKLYFVDLPICEKYAYNAKDESDILDLVKLYATKFIENLKLKKTE